MGGGGCWQGWSLVADATVQLTTLDWWWWWWGGGGRGELGAGLERLERYGGSIKDLLHLMHLAPSFCRFGGQWEVAEFVKLMDTTRYSMIKISKAGATLSTLQTGRRRFTPVMEDGSWHADKCMCVHVQPGSWKYRRRDL